MIVHSHVHGCYITEANTYCLANINIKLNDIVGANIFNRV